MSQKKLVKLIYYLNHEESTVSFDPNNKLSVLKTLINLTQKINLDGYEILYGKKKISWDEDKPLKEYIGKDTVPVFYLKKKEIYSNFKESINSNSVQSGNTSKLNISPRNIRISNDFNSHSRIPGYPF